MRVPGGILTGEKNLFLVRLEKRKTLPLRGTPHEEVLHNSLAQGHVVWLEGKLPTLPFAEASLLGFRVTANQPSSVSCSQSQTLVEPLMPEPQLSCLRALSA